jgi:hypothetical protein
VRKKLRAGLQLPEQARNFIYFKHITARFVVNDPKVLHLEERVVLIGAEVVAGKQGGCRTGSGAGPGKRKTTH